MGGLFLLVYVSFASMLGFSSDHVGLLAIFVRVMTFKASCSLVPWEVIEDFCFFFCHYFALCYLDTMLSQGFDKGDTGLSGITTKTWGLNLGGVLWIHGVPITLFLHDSSFLWHICVSPLRTFLLFRAPFHSQNVLRYEHGVILTPLVWYPLYSFHALYKHSYAAGVVLTASRVVVVTSDKVMGPILFFGTVVAEKLFKRTKRES